MCAGCVASLGALALRCAHDADVAPDASMPDSATVDAPLPNDGPVFSDVDDAPSAPSCAAQSVYMLSWAENLYDFDPGKLTFTKIGSLSCLPSNFSAFSMAVDRQGVAWIQGWVFVGSTPQWYFHEVSTADAGCVGQLTIPGSQNFETEGGGETFVTASATNTAETLYSVSLSGSSGSGSTFSVSTVSTYTGVVVPVGPLNTDPSSGMSLTGTGDGRMFAAESPVSTSDAGTNIVFTERDKTTAAPLSTANVTIPPSYIVVGMVFWGGDFWFFLRPTATLPWSIGRYRTRRPVVHDRGERRGRSGERDRLRAHGRRHLHVRAPLTSELSAALPAEVEEVVCGDDDGEHRRSQRMRERGDERHHREERPTARRNHPELTAHSHGSIGQ